MPGIVMFFSLTASVALSRCRTHIDGLHRVSKETCYFSVYCLLRCIAAGTSQLLAIHVVLAVEALLLTPKACLMVRTKFSGW